MYGKSRIERTICVFNYCEEFMIRGYSSEARAVINKFVRVSDIVTYLFCPYKLYLIKYLKLKSKPSRESVLGKIAHEVYLKASLMIAEKGDVDVNVLLNSVSHLIDKRFVSLDEVRRLVGYLVDVRRSIPLLDKNVRIEYEVCSDDLKLIGVVDLIEGNVPIEVKFKDSLSYRDIVQVALYVLLLENKFRVDIDVGYIDLLKIGERVKVVVNDKLRRSALELRDLVQMVSIAGLYSKRRENCSNCDLRMECRCLFT